MGRVGSQLYTLCGSGWVHELVGWIGSGQMKGFVPIAQKHVPYAVAAVHEGYKTFLLFLKKRDP